jgi:Asp-tRNA(Asn)/Glu-tRNA(Gln) amidotransferase A subunit family amidase
VAVLPPDVKKGKLRKPMPIAITFFGMQGDEPVLLKIGSAYESATHHRYAPPDFGPVKKGGGK